MTFFEVREPVCSFYFTAFEKSIVSPSLKHPVLYVLSEKTLHNLEEMTLKAQIRGGVVFFDVPTNESIRDYSAFVKKYDL